MSTLLARLFSLAVVVFASAWLVAQAWILIQPLLPVVILTVAAALVVRAFWKRTTRW